MFIKDCVDALIHSVHVVAESIAFLMGMHLMLLLHLIQFFACRPIDTVRQTAHRTRRGIAFAPNEIEPTNELIARRRTRNALVGTRSERQNPIHLPALGPRPHDEKSVLYDPSTLLHRFEAIFTAWTDQVSIRMRNMADQIEMSGGRAGHFVSSIRHCESHLDANLLGKLPPEIINHILILAAMPSATSTSVPTKIAVLSKAHYRMITPRLYSNVHLSDALSFRRFRMTLAVHNTQLGHHVRALSVASSRFDSDGYLPDQVAEHVTLGVGIEQILLASPNLKHLYLDLFSLAALHNGTASRLEKGALPISLTTEFSLPQYLTLPTFVHLKHVELTVFGLDNNAVDWLRQVLPRLRSLTIRWVTRHNRSTAASISQLDGDLASACKAAWQDQDDFDLDHDELIAWRPGGRRHDDFLLFVEAVELLRRWPYHTAGHADGSADGRQLEAITVYAWPKAYRELRRHYSSLGLDDKVVIPGGLSEQNRGQLLPASWWDKSVYAFDSEIDEPSVFGDAVRRSFDSSTLVAFNEQRRPLHTLSASPNAGVGTPSTVLPPAPLRIAVDPSSDLGPRRGPLEAWRSRRRAGVWN